MFFENKIAHTSVSIRIQTGSKICSIHGELFSWPTISLTYKFLSLGAEEIKIKMA